MAWIVYPKTSNAKTPVVVVVHEIFGLSPWIRGVADQVAAEGFIAIAPDLVSKLRGGPSMLALIARTGTEFGISVLVTSHLLGEIERVCEQLIAIDAGKLRYNGPVAAFTELTERLVIELDDDIPELVPLLQSRGLDVDGTGGGTLLRITVRDDSTYDVIRDAAAELGAPIARMQLTRHKLEELFRDQVGVHG